MRQFVMGTLALAILVGVAATAQAQIGGKKGPDKRVKALLDELELKYEVDDDNDFKLVFEVGESGRSQIVWIRSNTEDFRTLEIREIMSPGYVAEGDDIPHYVAIKLLEDNRAKKMGGWQKDGKYAVFVSHIGADLDAETLHNVLIFTVEAADEMEKQLTGEKDQF
ncbi:MAG: hypothetical protein KDA69_02385 [Planctomycetaceae bacterium]|nr:hypothetical protein [Planctomycetaceae bacterium]MCA9043136.1 hypothetical protein [Planctomycetaceae bacterium]